MADPSIPHYTAPPNRFSEPVPELSVTSLERAVRAVRDMEWDELGEPPNTHDCAREIVRTVLLAIREPSEAMVQAATSFETFEGKMQHNEHEAGVARETWQAMIDAALEEGS